MYRGEAKENMTKEVKLSLSQIAGQGNAQEG